MVQLHSTWILWLAHCYFVFTSGLILTMPLMQDGLGCCLSHALFDLEFFGILFFHLVANKEGTKTSISKKFVSVSKSCCNVDTCEQLV